MNKCEMCGRSVQSVPLSYVTEYGVWLCNDCLSSVKEVNENLFGKVLTEHLFKHCNHDYVQYNKFKEENKMKAKRDITKKETVSLTSVSELKPRDEIKVKVGENVYPAIVVREPHWLSGDADRCLDISVLLNSPIKSMTWEDLGYDCFEDMIDDIAKEHRSLKYNYDEFIASKIESLDPDQAVVFAEDLCNKAKKGRGLKLLDLYSSFKFAQRFKEEHPLYKYVPVEPAKFIRDEERLKWLRNELTPAEIKWVKDMYKDCAHPAYQYDRTPPYIKIHDATHEGKKYVLADTFGKSIIRVINKDGSSSIYDAEQCQVYLEKEDEGKSIDEE